MRYVARDFEVFMYLQPNLSSSFQKNNSDFLIFDLIQPRKKKSTNVYEIKKI